MKQQINLFFHALFFYSRIPAGKINYSEENLTKAFRYFPLIGIIVGAIGGGIFLLSGGYSRFGRPCYIRSCNGDRNRGPPRRRPIGLF